MATGSSQGMFQFVRSGGCSFLKPLPRKLSQSHFCHILYSKAVLKPILIQRERGTNPRSQQETWIWSQHYQILPAALFSLHHKGLMAVSSSGSDLCTCTCPHPWNIIILMLGVRKALVSCASWLFTVFSFYCQSPRLGKLLERKKKKWKSWFWSLTIIKCTHYCMRFNVFWVKKRKMPLVFSWGTIGLISNFDHWRTSLLILYWSST